VVRQCAGGHFTFLYLLRLDLCQKYLFWRKFHGLLRRMCIVLLLDETLCRYLLSLDVCYFYVYEVTIFLSLLTNLGLNFTLSHISVATSACFGGPFA
jgi:hypothetical protein